MNDIRLRKFQAGDAPRVAELVNDYELSRWTSSIPYPYSLQDAVGWIAQQPDSERCAWAVVHDDSLVGCVSHWPDADTAGAEEIGYWIGRHWWGRGICSAALELLFQQPGFPVQKPLVAKVMKGNPASGRPLLKAGFRAAGTTHIEVRGQSVESLQFEREAVEIQP